MNIFREMMLIVQQPLNIDYCLVKHLLGFYHIISTFYDSENQSVENTGVAFVKGADERNEFFKKK